MHSNVIFMGSHEIAIPLLKKIQSMNNCIISGIVTQSDKPVGRGNKLTPTKIADFARTNNIPILKPNKPDLLTSDWMKEQGCDLILVMAYGHILRSNILNLAPYGIYNFHGSILPKYRGASPIETAILNGEKETGVTLMKIVPAMDAGDIVDIEKVYILSHDTSIEVYQKMANACVPLIERNLLNLFSGKITTTKQNEDLVTFTKKFTTDDMKLDFANDFAVNIKNRVRALAIRGNCFFEYNGEVFKVGKCQINTQNFNLTAGSLACITKYSVIFSTKESNIEILEIQKQGGKMLKVSDFLNGFNVFKQSKL